MPVLFTAAGRQRAATELAIASITSIGHAGFLAGRAAIGLVARRDTLGPAIVALAIALVFLAVGVPLVASNLRDPGPAID